jgi:hypothetical protein
MSDELPLRVCSRCRAAKPLADFPIKNAAKGSHRSYCRPCRSEYGKEHYRKNLAAYLGRARTRNSSERPRNRRLVADYLATHPCVDCGEPDPVVLEFDHRDPMAKTSDVGRLIHSGNAIALRAEIDKCDVRCGNCHRIRTATQFGSYRLLEANGAYFV